MDGSVNIDNRRPYTSGASAELDINNRPIATSGGRYQATYQDANNNTVMADYLAYAPGLTRDWQYVNPSQGLAKPGYMAFDVYSAVTQGEGLTGNRVATGGVDVTLAHLLSNPHKKVTFSLTSGLTLSGISSSRSGQVTSTLHTYTDYYSLHGAAVPVTTIPSEITAGLTYKGPSGISTVLSDNTIYETTTTISDNPDISGVTNDLVNGATVTGLWKLKGAYLTLKLGPQVSAMLTHSLGVSAAIGVAGSYAGTNYTANESFTVVGVEKAITLAPQSSTVNKFLPGYYANIEANWAVNDRTGFFAGLSYDNLGDYDQSVGGRTARIDLSSMAGVRGGLSIKF
jgi:hypothetical protein